jgi:hypothetical protein
MLISAPQGAQMMPTFCPHGRTAIFDRCPADGAPATGGSALPAAVASRKVQRRVQNIKTNEDAKASSTSFSKHHAQSMLIRSRMTALAPLRGDKPSKKGLPKQEGNNDHARA